jgi:hypothetical protein
LWTALGIAFIAIESMVYMTWQARAAFAKQSMEAYAKRQQAIREQKKRKTNEEEQNVQQDTLSGASVFLSDNETDDNAASSSPNTRYSSFSETQRDNNAMPGFSTTDMRQMNERLRRKNIEKLRSQLGTTPEEDGDSLEMLVRMRHERKYQIKGKATQEKALDAGENLRLGTAKSQLDEHEKYT